MKPLASVLVVLTLLLSACGDGARVPSEDQGTGVVAEAPPAYQNLSPVAFAEMIGKPDAVLLDVRTPGEIARGKINGALEIDYRGEGFADRVRALDPAQTYLVYCASGGRSSKTCELMAAAGFTRLYNLEGGYSAWTK